MEIGRSARARHPAAAEGFDLEDFAVAARTLRDHAGEQISFAFADPAAAADRRAS